MTQLLTSVNGKDERMDERALARLPADDRALLTPEVVDRWARDLAPEDIDPAEIVGLERRRLANLRTIRQGVDLTDMEFKLIRFLQRANGRIRTYVQIAHHLWGTADRPITGRHLQARDGYASPYVQHIWVLVGSVRKKLEIDPARPQHLALRRGVGYSWHDSPPSLDDGLNYVDLANEVDRLRIEVRYELGGEIGAAPIPRPALHPQLGPGHPDYVEGDVTDRRSAPHNQPEGAAEEE